MPNTSDQTRSARRKFARRGLTTLLASLLATSPAHAIFPVEDYAALVQDQLHISNTMLQWGKEIAQWGKELDYWQRQYEHYQQQLIKLTRLNLQLIKLSETLEERPENFGVEDTCGGSISIFDIRKLISKAVNLGGNISEQQTEICQRRVLVENKKYNLTVKMFNDLANLSQANLDKIRQQRDSVGTSQGNLSANDNEIMTFIADSQLRMQSWSVEMAGYDGYLASLDRQQSNLARRAMDGDKGKGPLAEIRTKLVQAAALKIALSADR